MFGERALYESPWVWLGQVDVELPGRERFWHHIVRLHQAAMMVLVDGAEVDAAGYGQLCGLGRLPDFSGPVGPT